MDLGFSWRARVANLWIMGPIDDAGITAVRIVLAAAGLALALIWERSRPFRRRAAADWRHEARNLALWALNAILVPLVGAAALLVAALWAGSHSFGVIPRLGAPSWVGVAATILVLDAVTYALHRLYHASPLLWRLHQVHHSDADFGATTGVRFHALEVLLSAILRVPVIVALGASPLGVAIFEAWLLLASQLQHADVRLSRRVDAAIRTVLITPGVHRVHHSKEWIEADSNYGTIFTWWDRALGTLELTRAPEQIETGLPDETDRERSLPALLAMPFLERGRERPPPGTPHVPAHRGSA